NLTSAKKNLDAPKYTDTCNCGHGSMAVYTADEHVKVIFNGIPKDMKIYEQVFRDHGISYLTENSNILTLDGPKPVIALYPPKDKQDRKKWNAQVVKALDEITSKIEAMQADQRWHNYFEGMVEKEAGHLNIAQQTGNGSSVAISHIDNKRAILSV